jgi:hypothetical protein
MKFLNISLFSIIAICFFTVSCTVPIQKTEQVSKKPTQIKKIALIPFSYKPRYSVEESASYLVVPDKEKFLTNALYNGLATKVKGVDIDSLDGSISEFAKTKKENPGLTYKEIALKVGKNLGADAVLIGDIFVYREREGTELSIVSPASVAFDVQLLSIAIGETIWEDYFTETQQPLLENVAEFGKFIKRKGRWVTADELAKEGAEEVVDKLNKFLE